LGGVLNIEELKKSPITSKSFGLHN
jgi:hypothetical protein